MAHAVVNLTTAAGFLPLLMEATAASQTIKLSPDRRFQLVHLGVDAANSAQTAPIYCTFAVPNGTPPTITAAFPTVATTTGAATILLSGKPVTVGPGLGTMSFIGTAAQETFLLIPV